MYGIKVEDGGKHNLLRLGNNARTFSKGTHSSPRAGLNFAQDVITLIEKSYDPETAMS